MPYALSFQKMKIFLRTGLAILLCAGLLASQADAGTIEVAFSDGSAQQTLMTRNERNVEFLQLQHLAAIFEIEMSVDPVDGRVVLSKQGKSASFFPGQQTVIADRRSYFLETPPLEIEGRIMVPLEFLSSILPLVYDRELRWDAARRTLSAGIQNLEILSLSFSPYGDSTRIIVKTNKEPSYTVSEKLPSMLIFNLPQAKLNIRNNPLTINTRSVKQVKVIDTFGTTQIIIRLGEDFSRYTHKVLKGPPRLLIDAYNTRESRIEAPVSDSGGIIEQDLDEATPAQARVEASQPFSLQTVVIDPGHGGSDRGIIVASGTEDRPELLEKQLTLHIAQLLGTALTHRLGVRSIFTRETDEFVSSESRTTIANSSRADIFLSIHVNNSFFPTHANFEAYVMDYGSLDLPEGYNEINARTQLLDYAQARYITQSSRLAQQIVNAYVVRSKDRRAVVKHAPLFTLKGATMPSVHLEIGYTSNEASRTRLLQETFQQAIVAAIVDGIAAFTREEEQQ
ncbi:hypothetical protein CSB45_01045 [candidate division KSB3 bacterium]|uniref:MurNAc-LAA domain-containing protein n=1 Tax=candidate division KSB3 bacterium TaxID=2044937 RepID=A0A2G6EAB5_9BACT|nr:MAG: hypothetical protein CSB45_01045 [candidate division KSB3 bacterium]PIE30810.1 MAG: hypothetical protein CSA57_02305 [candidate division KSB3 bacterium]